jgi:hypothetical protein
MNEKEYNNVFRFSLYQGNVLLGEKIFNADQFNPFTRYSIDIREILPRAITKLQKALSKRGYETMVGVGCNNPEGVNEYVYDLYQYNQKMINLYPPTKRGDMRYNPQPVSQQVEDFITKETKTIRGVECKIGFYINDKPIVERVFYVDGFNPVARWSVDLTYTVVEIGNSIFEKIKRNDIKNMWEDYDLINIKGLSITQIRELSTAKREDMLRKLRRV